VHPARLVPGRGLPRRGGCHQCHSAVNKAVRYSRNPVGEKQRGHRRGARLSGSVVDRRAAPSRAYDCEVIRSSRVISAASQPRPSGATRSRRSRASATMTSQSFTALSRAKIHPACTSGTRTSCQDMTRKGSQLVGGLNQPHCRTVLWGPLEPPRRARCPRSFGTGTAMTRTMRSTDHPLAMEESGRAYRERSGADHHSSCRRDRHWDGHWRGERPYDKPWYDSRFGRMGEGRPGVVAPSVGTRRGGAGGGGRGGGGVLTGVAGCWS